MRLKLSFVLVGFVCCLALVGAAVGGIWRPMGPYGDITYDLAMAPEDASVLFVACNGGLYKSIDAGAGWDHVGEDYKLYALWSVSAARAGRDLVIATDRLHVYLSVDGGVSWQQVVGEPAFTGASFNSVAIDPRNPEVVWACTDKGPCCSVNSGNDWVLRNDGLPANFDAGFVRFDLSDPSSRTLYLCGSQGIYRCDSFGYTWHPVVSGFGANDLAVDPEDSETLYACTDVGVFKTIDGGASWAPKNAGLSQLSVRRLAISALDANVLYCTVKNQLHISEDGAESWQQRDQGLQIGYGASRLIASPVAADVAYVGTPFGVYETIDRGASWCAVNRGILAATVTDMAFHPSLLGTIFVTTQVGFFRTTDNGQNWDLMSLEGSAENCLDANAVALDPQEPSTVYAGTNRGKVIKSVDDGDTWVELYAGGPSVLALAIDPSDPQTIYMSTSVVQVLKSQDGGYTWAPATSGMTTGYQGKALAIDPKDPPIVWSGTSSHGFGDAYRSKDRANSWEQIIARETYDIAISPVEPDTVYVAGPAGLVIASSDGSGGYTFQEDQPGLLDKWVNNVKIAPGNPDIVYLGTGAMGLTSLLSGVYKTTNGGESWTQLPCEGMVGKRCGYVAADPYVPTEIWAGFEANALLKYSEQAGPPIDMSLSTNQSEYVAGDIQVARISATNSGGDINVDLYIAIMLPDGSLLFWPDLSSLMHPGFSMTPMPRGFSMSDVVFFSMTLPDSLPAGSYTWFGIFFAQGTQDAVSNLASAEWTFQP
ncbi:MAG: hypothetical protein JW759_08180 [Candidatus Coatesbacteria bacterium]|nr:hypothetical protein [Candidatus Coatesbacteria bacterium]